jgi:hypothetical protein
VEKPGVCRLPYMIGGEMLDTIYGVRVGTRLRRCDRVEFSLHPLRRGYRQEHMTVWEREEVGEFDFKVKPSWPNRFSEFIGDKLFGLLVADAIGLPVPRTTAICQNLRPFQFGHHPMTGDYWLRTCPAVPQPGKLLTQKGWANPFEVGMSDPAIRAILSQEGVEAAWSGACITGKNGAAYFEGVEGEGDRFMVGEAAPIEIPEDIKAEIREAYDRLCRAIGPSRFEWVVDPHGQLWIVQLHVGATESNGQTIYPGEPENGWLEFEVHHGLDNLRTIAGCALANLQGIVLVGNVGVTSHFGDVLRKAQIPARLQEK